MDSRRATTIADLTAHHLRQTVPPCRLRRTTREAAARRSNICLAGHNYTRDIAVDVTELKNGNGTRVARKTLSTAWCGGRDQPGSDTGRRVAERIASWVNQLISFILTSGITCILALIIVPTIHESGHAAACIIQGGVVTHWKLLFRNRNRHRL
jgi:hypothetical protein